MRSIVIKYGLISGGVIAVCLFASLAFSTHESSSMILGFSIMIAAFISISFAMRRYRADHPDERFTYWKAFQVGILITLLASVLYVILWKIYMSLFIPDFMEKYSAKMLQNLQNSSLSKSEIAEQTKGVIEARENYKNPIYFFLYTMAEIFPVGLLATLVFAAIHRTRKAKAVSRESQTLGGALDQA